MKIVHVVFAAALAATVVGCSGRKQHLTNDWGKSYDAAFAGQWARSQSEPATAVTGLDSQEAAIISDGYRAGLAPKGTKVKEEPVIVVTPPSRDRQQPLAPSVPKEK